MPNFCMCDDDKCPYKEKCKRHIDSGTRPDIFQLWGFFEKVGSRRKPEHCKGYMPKRE